jgi:hypothetical protein
MLALKYSSKFCCVEMHVGGVNKSPSSGQIYYGKIPVRDDEP